jgi:hypothetical protein
MARAVRESCFGANLSARERFEHAGADFIFHAVRVN